MDINNIIDENVNVINIHICLKNEYNNKNINLELNNEILNKIKSNFKITKEYKLISYYKKNLIYSYDTTDDNQILNYIKYINDTYYKLFKKIDLYYIALNENKLPNYYMPCTNEMDNKEEYDIIEFKINNRLILIIKNNTLYLQYRYNKNVEMEKIQILINNILKKINNII